MNKIEKLKKAHQQINVLAEKQDNIFNDIVEELDLKEIEDYVFDYLFNGVGYSMSIVETTIKNQEIAEEKRPARSWWHRKK